MSSAVLPGAMRRAALLSLLSLLLGAPACRHDVEQGPDAGGQAEGEGESEGEGEGEGEGECPPDPVMGMTAVVEDSATQFHLCGAHVEIQEAAYIETLTQQGSTNADCVYVGAQDRPGTYQVRATADGYQDFDVSGIQVEADACGKPVPATVTVRMTAQ